jgi:hypothetical protein
MDLFLVLLAAATFPVACLGFVLWMARIEDSIPDAVRRATRSPDPAPVLAVPVRRATPAAVVAIPEQRTEPPVVAVAAPPAAAAPAAAAAPPATSAPAGT